MFAARVLVSRGQTLSGIAQYRKGSGPARLPESTAVSERQLSFLESELGSGPRLGPLEDMFVFTIFLFQDFNQRQVTKLGHRTDTRQVCFSLKSKVYTLSAAKCVSLSLQVIAP